jgi:pyridoxal phosphate enzyme (YggS family)
MFNSENYQALVKEVGSNVQLVAVSKFKSAEDIMKAYEAGQRDFGENYVQELLEKHDALPKDIRWHFIGHLQSNKVKYIAPFIHLVHGVDSVKLLKELNKQGKKLDRIISCLLQIHIAAEETKFGFSESELNDVSLTEYDHLDICGLMGMASFSEEEQILRNEFSTLKNMYEKLRTEYPSFNILSMGMSNDYKIAIEEGSNMVRIGSLIFGNR